MDGGEGLIFNATCAFPFSVVCLGGERGRERYRGIVRRYGNLMNGIFSNFFRVELKLEKTRVFNYYESHVGSLLIKETLSRE